MTIETKYSKRIITKILGEEGSERKYQVNVLGAKCASYEAFKMGKLFIPSLGVGADSFINQDSFGMLDASQTMTGMAQILVENLSEDHFTDLCDKLLGCMMVNGNSVDNWSDHFDENPGDFFEILGWIGKETFHSFFTESTILKYWIRKIKETVPMNVKGKIESFLNEVKQETKEELKEVPENKTPV